MSWKALTLMETWVMIKINNVILLNMINLAHFWFLPANPLSILHFASGPLMAGHCVVLLLLGSRLRLFLSCKETTLLR